MNSPRLRHNRGSKALTSRLGEIIARRRGGPPAPDLKSISLKSDTAEIVNLDAQAKPLSDILAKARLITRPARGTDYLHVSDLLHNCIRRVALVETMNIPPQPQTLNLTSALTFAQGEAIHDVLKERATAGGPRLMWGHWSCRCGTCSTPTPSLFSEVDPGQRCPACKGPLDRYKEVDVRNEQYKIVGHPDMLLLIPGLDALHVTELKSISHDKWKDLVRPEPDHVLQSLFYWFLLREDGYRLTDRCSVVYATKGWMFSGEPHKEFTFDAETIVHRLDPYLEDALALKASRTGGDLPVRTCSSEMDPNAKKCEVCKACFGVTNEKPVNVSIAAALGRRTTPTPAPAARPTAVPTSRAGDRPVAEQHGVRVQRRRPAGHR